MKDTENLAEEPEVDYEHTSSAGETNISPFNQNEIEIEKPSFQWAFSWTNWNTTRLISTLNFKEKIIYGHQKQRSKLIGSILLGLPLPAFYFDTSKKQWDIVDGLQRCCSIDNFCVKNFT